jgi:hypothetical protein
VNISIDTVVINPMNRIVMVSRVHHASLTDVTVSDAVLGPRARSVPCGRGRGCRAAASRTQSLTQLPFRPIPRWSNVTWRQGRDQRPANGGRNRYRSVDGYRLYPSGHNRTRGPVAQRSEQGTFNPRVLGSNPSRLTSMPRSEVALRPRVKPAPRPFDSHRDSHVGTSWWTPWVPVDYWPPRAVAACQPSGGWRHLPKDADQPVDPGRPSVAEPREPGVLGRHQPGGEIVEVVQAA